MLNDSTFFEECQRKIKSVQRLSTLSKKNCRNFCTYCEVQNG